MNKLGYKQKGIPMLKSPVKAVNLPDPKNLKVVDLVTKGKADKKAREENLAKTASNRATTMNEILKPFRSGESAGYNSYRNRRKEVLATKKEVFSKANNSNPKSFRELSNFPKPANPFDSVTVEGVKIGSLNSAPKNDPPPPPPPPKVKTSFKDAYAKRDMKTYGNLSQAEFTTEAKRQLKGGKVPGSQMKGKGKGETTTSTKRKPIISDEAFEKRAKAQGQKPRDGKTKGKKVNITDAQFNKRAKAQGQKPTDGKAPKVDKVLSKRELRLANVKRKAANEKTRTNKTAQSIDANKPKSADTGAKQTSARRSRAKAKRLENRATRIQGRIDRKGKSSAEKKASRKATRQKIKENR